MLASVICILIPTSITLTTYNYFTQDAVKDQAISNSQESMQLVNNYVTNSLKYMLNIANLIQMDSGMSAIMKKRAMGEGYTGPNAEYEEFSDRDKIVKQIENMINSGEQGSLLDFHTYVTVLLSNGDYYSTYSVNEYNPIDMTREPWFSQTKNLYGFNSLWVGPSPTVFESEKKKNPYQLSVIRTLREQNSSFIFGYVVVTVMENQINHNFERLVGNQDFMIVDSDNVIVSNNDSDKIGGPLNLPDLPAATDQITTELVKVDHEDYLVTQQSLFTGWKLVSLTPYKKAVSKINSIFSKVFTFQFVCFILFLLLLLYLLRTFTKPLVGLGKVAMTVQKGNLQVRSKIRGEDEIGRLGFWFDQMLDRIQEMIQEISVTQARKRKAELDMLQAQINPHFLFNVLNSIRMKVMFRGDKESAEMIGSLSKLLRMTINQEKSIITLHEEIEIVMDYTQLMNMRQKEKIVIETDVSADSLLEKVPRFFLQPLIENALIHGLNQAAGIIRVEARREGHMLIVAVEDNGSGMDSGTLNKLRDKLAARRAPDPVDGESHRGFSGIGLLNVNERMLMTHGEGFHMQVDSEPGAGTRITMFIPSLEVT
ncbi:sensor histidine kinase [Paenibacillus doosanensis]|nr:sensor histidine kinase [Paenibacillus konkukensis]MCS7461955.1 sensor histidine kinase [Paenibacillus doosanensis]